MLHMKKMNFIKEQQKSPNSARCELRWTHTHTHTHALTNTHTRKHTHTQHTCTHAATSACLRPHKPPIFSSTTCTFAFPRISSLGPSHVTKQFRETAQNGTGQFMARRHCLLGTPLPVACPGLSVAVQCTGAAFRVSSDFMPLRDSADCCHQVIVFSLSHTPLFLHCSCWIFLNFEVIFKTSDKITKMVQTVSYTISQASPKKPYMFTVQLLTLKKSILA